MKKDVNQEIIIHKNKSNIFDIIGKEEDNDEDEVDTSSFKEMFEAMSKL